MCDLQRVCHQARCTPHTAVAELAPVPAAMLPHAAGAESKNIGAALHRPGKWRSGSTPAAPVSLRPLLMLWALHTFGVSHTAMQAPHPARRRRRQAGDARACYPRCGPVICSRTFKLTLPQGLRRDKSRVTTSAKTSVEFMAILIMTTEP